MVCRNCLEKGVNFGENSEKRFFLGKVWEKDIFGKSLGKDVLKFSGKCVLKSLRESCFGRFMGKGNFVVFDFVFSCFVFFYWWVVLGFYEI